MHRRLNRLIGNTRRNRSLGFESLEDRRLLTVTPGSNLSTGTQLTTFTLALATTAEYTQVAGGKAATQALLNQFVTKLNKLFESELAISFQLHAQNDRLIFVDPNTDGYSNGNSPVMFSENPIVINTALNGSSTNDSGYDIGHVLGIGTEGGLAGIAQKASGVTNLRRADATDLTLSLVGHEIGHQLNANHSFNGITGSCLANRNPISAVEPGSGSSIMAYSTACGSDNLTEFPGDGLYFHAVSFNEIIDYIANTIPQRGSKTTTGNALPTVNAGVDRVIPASTPFTLTANATDPNSADRLTYTWEQIDLSPAGAALPISNSQDATGPLFRSLAPTADPARTFPRIQSIVANTPANQNKDEHLPTQNRLLNFRVTARDNHLFNGKTVSGVRSDDVKLTVVNTGAPFRVTSLNGANPQLTGGSQQTITWNVAGTDSNGINTSNVDILLSVDGGLTYPVKLSTQTVNDGSEMVTIPNVSAAKARIMVQADPAQNVFFDINDTDISINQNLAAPGGVVIVESAGETKIAEGLFVQTGLPATDTYTIALTQAPTAAVSVTITADAQTQVSLDGATFASTQTVTFTAGDSTSKTVTVRAIDDSVGEGAHTGVIHQAVTLSADPNYNPQILVRELVNSVSARISDDDAPPMIGVELDFRPPSNSTPVMWNRADNPFTVNLTNLIRENGDPTTADFAIAITNGSVAGWSNRTMDNSTIPQHSPALDAVSDLMYWEATRITGTWSGLKPNSKYRVYLFAQSEVIVNSDLPIRQTITITGSGVDNPAPFVQDGTGKISGQGQNKTLHLFVNGTVGSSANPVEQYALVVTSSPSGNITIQVAPAAGVPAVASGFAIQEFLEPTPGITVTETNGNSEVSEAGTTDTFTVQLDAQPTNDVVLDIANNDPGEVNLDKTSLVFTSTTWNTPQVVTMTGRDDPRIDGDQATDVTTSVRVAQSDPRYASVPAKTVVVTTTDNDVAGFSKLESAGITEVSETGTTDTFTVVLTAQPAADVVFNVASANTNEVTVDKATLTFTSANWDQAQTVTVTGIDDAVVDGEKTTAVSITINVAQSDPQFSNVTAQSIAVKTRDDEPAPWQNPNVRFDVSGDGTVVPLDVLRIINELNDPRFHDAQGKLPNERPDGGSFYDVNGDGFVTTNDALQVINFLNAQAVPEGEWAPMIDAIQFQTNNHTDDDDLEQTIDELASQVWRNRRALVPKPAFRT